MTIGRIAPAKGLGIGEIGMTVQGRWPEDVSVRETAGSGDKLYAQAVAATGGRSIFLAGSIPVDADNAFVGEGKLHAQPAHGLAAIRSSLAQFGPGPAHAILH